ncbi:MAG: hypothetical protein WD356_08520 [Pseudomonadales bacterium]
MTALKQRYLKAMGIEVWVRKGLVAASAMPGSEDTVLPEPGLDSASVRLGIIVYEGLGVVFAMPQEDRVAACHRLCNDIALAMTGRESAGKASELKCEASSGVPPGEVVNEKLPGLPPRIIAFGDLAREYFHGGALNEVVQRHDKLVLGAPDLNEIVARPVIKRDIWQGLLKLQGA